MRIRTAGAAAAIDLLCARLVVRSHLGGHGPDAQANASVGWHPPEVGFGRFGAWLENNMDWALSRDRYWGTPLPVWVCDADPEHTEVIGSYDQLSERWGRPLPAGFDPHKPFIDSVTWMCACGGTMRRTPEVIDTWFDSGAMPYAQWHYPFEHESEFESHFPADFICEGIDQTRGWFYSLLAIAVTAFEQAPYRNVVVNELVLDSDGQKMSKSRGNVVEPWDVIQTFGADTVRLYLIASSQVWLPKRFDARTIAEVAGGFFETLKHTYTFFALYAGDWSPAPAPSDRPLVDRWLASRLAATVEAVTASWAAYDVTTGLRALMDFVVDDLSNWYVRINRDRFWAPDTTPDPAALATLYEALLTTARLLAPAAPFVSDWLHRALGDGSVHLARFPDAGAARDPGLEQAMAAIRQLVSLGRAGRESAGLRVTATARAYAGCRAGRRVGTVRERVAGTAPNRGQRQIGGGGGVGRRSRSPEGQAQFSGPRQAVRERDAGSRQGGVTTHPGAAASAGRG